MSVKIEIHFDLSSNTQIIEIDNVQNNISLTEILKSNDIFLNLRCGGNGICDGCKIELIKGNLLYNNEHISTKTLPIPLKACLCKIVDDNNIVIKIPARSLLENLGVVISDFYSDKLDKIDISYHKNNTIKNDKLHLGLAIDIGTSTVAILLVNLFDGIILKKSTALNAQTKYGDDVISRIKLCTENKEMIKEFRNCILFDTITPLIETMLEEYNIDEIELSYCYIAGNTTMLHLLTNTDPSPMGAIPFQPAFLDSKIYTGNELGIKLKEGSRLSELNELEIHLLPGISAFVGADLTAGSYALNLFETHKTDLLVDIGTNGEIVLVHKQNFYSCAAAAGPAFEGFGLVSGLRAVNGAIKTIHFDESFNIHINTINNQDPVGICGSAYIDFLAEAMNLGMIDTFGRFVEEKIPDNILTKTEEGIKSLIIAENIFITEQDISFLLQAKAAIAAGIQILLKKAAISEYEVDTLYLAGGFGVYVDISNAIKSGLLPKFKINQIKPAGNTSLAGAYLSLLNPKIIQKMDSYSKKVEVIELNLDPDFENYYIDNLML